MNLNAQRTVRALLLMIITITSWILMDSMESLDFVCKAILTNIVLVQVIAYNPKKAFNFYYIFISALALFHFGQVITYLFDIDVVVSNAYDLFDLYSKNVMLTALKFCIKGYNLIALTGFVFAYREKSTESLTAIKINEKTEIVYNFGKIAFWVLLVPLLVYDITLLRLGFSHGYEAKYMYNNVFLASVDVYFPISIMCIMIGSPQGNKAWRYYYIFAIARMALQMFIVGNRGPLVINLLIYELIRMSIHSSDKKRKFKFVYLIVGVVVAMLISFIAVSRGAKAVSFSEFLTDYNFLALFLSEFGSTLITPILTVIYTGQHAFLMGKTYLGGLAVLLPFSSRYMADVRSYMNVGALMNPYSPNEGALGGSLFADMFINYGQAGLFISIILGMIVGIISCRTMSLKRRTFSISLTFYYLNSLLLYVRGSSQDIFLGLKRVIYLAIVYVIFEFCYKKLATRRKT